MKNFKNILLIIILCAIGFIFMGIFLFTREEGSVCTISKNGEIIDTLPLGRDTVYDIEKDGELNRIIIKNGKIYMETASCPDKLCINMGEIHLAGESIVCLPNRVIVSVRDTNGDSGYDVISGF